MSEAFCVFREENGDGESERHGGGESLHDGEVQGPRDLDGRVASRGAEANARRGGRARPAVVHGPRGPSEVVRGDTGRDGGCARRRDGLRRILDHGLQRDRGVGHGRDPRPRHVPADAEAGRRARSCARLAGRPHDLRRGQAGRRAVRGRPALRPARRARPHAKARFRRVQRRPRARVLPLRGRPGHEDARRGRLLRDDRPGRGDRGAQRHDQRARVRRDPGRVPPPRGRARRSTRSTCATRTRSRWPTTR